MNRDRHDPHPLAPDDPRLSEWLDGRLTAAEAAEVERLVAASPELTRLVADLRGMRGALGAVPVTPPPAGFVRDVLAAVDAAGDEAADEAEVEEEWRRIERQRLEGEIAEAHDDAAETVPEPMRQRWPWLALAGALAAGVLAAIVINRPGGPVDREVALVDQPPAAKRAASAEKDKDVDTWLEEAADGAAADAVAVAPAREKAAEQFRALADRQANADGESLARKSDADQERRARGRDAVGTVERQAKGADGGGGYGVGADAGARANRAAVPAAPLAAAAPHAPPRDAPDADQRPVRVVTYRIRTAADRTRLDELVAARGADEKKPRRLAQEAERIEISGPASAMARLAAALEAAPAGEALAKAEAKEAEAGKAVELQGQLAADQLQAAEAARRGGPGEFEQAGEPDMLLVIEVVDESQAAAGEDRP